MGGGASYPKADVELQKACKTGDLDAAKAAVEAGADINSFSPYPPLIWAAWNNSAAICSYLISLEDSHNVQLDIKSDKLVKGGNAVHAATGRNHLEAFMALIERDKVSQHVKNEDLDDPYLVIGKYASKKGAVAEKPLRDYYLSSRKC
jgi:ankyrin repeat protein